MDDARLEEREGERGPGDVTVIEFQGKATSLCGFFVVNLFCLFVDLNNNLTCFIYFSQKVFLANLVVFVCSSSTISS